MAAGNTTCVTSAQIEAEIARVITAQSLPVSDAHIYSVFFPPGVQSCDGPGSCSESTFCGYHSAVTVKGTQVLYSDEPYPDLQGCNTGQSPNGNAYADTAIKTESHELAEAITDPYGSGWGDAAGNEIGDECSQNYGVPLGSTNPVAPSTTRYNQVIGTGKYYLQTEFSNSDYAANNKKVRPDARRGAHRERQPRVDDRRHDECPNDGSTTDNVYAQVTSGGNPVVGDTVTFTDGTTGGSCGTTTTNTATTDAGGYAYAYYTASTGNANCVVIATALRNSQTVHGSKF